MNIFHDLDRASYNRVMDLFDVWLRKHNIDSSDRAVRSEVEGLVGGVLESAMFSEAITEDLKDEWKE